MSSSAPSTSTAPPVRNDENIYITEDGKRRRICSFFVPDYSKPKRCIGCNEIKEDWLGTGFLEFEEAREVVRAAKLANEAAWNTWRKHKRPPYIPSTPQTEYAGKGWAGIKDWLETGFLEFEEARKVVRAAKLANQAAWRTWRIHKRPPNIPSNPARKYAGKGWVGYKDWLGTINLQV